MNNDGDFPSIPWEKAPTQSIVYELKAYVEHGIPPEDWVRAMLENDWLHSVLGADPNNFANIRKWAMFFHWQLPARCWGSPGAVAMWQAHGGLAGLDALGQPRGMPSGSATAARLRLLRCVGGNATPRPPAAAGGHPGGSGEGLA